LRKGRGGGQTRDTIISTTHIHTLKRQELQVDTLIYNTFTQHKRKNIEKKTHGLLVGNFIGFRVGSNVGSFVSNDGISVGSSVEITSTIGFIVGSSVVGFFVVGSIVGGDVGGLGVGLDVGGLGVD